MRTDEELANILRDVLDEYKYSKWHDGTRSAARLLYDMGRSDAEKEAEKTRADLYAATKDAEDAQRALAAARADLLTVSEASGIVYHADGHAAAPGQARDIARAIVQTRRDLAACEERARYVVLYARDRQAEPWAREVLAALGQPVPGRPAQEPEHGGAERARRLDALVRAAVELVFARNDIVLDGGDEDDSTTPEEIDRVVVDVQGALRGEGTCMDGADVAWKEALGQPVAEREGEARCTCVRLRAAPGTVGGIEFRPDCPVHVAAPPPAPLEPEAQKAPEPVRMCRCGLVLAPDSMCSHCGWSRPAQTLTPDDVRKLAREVVAEAAAEVCEERSAAAFYEFVRVLRRGTP